MSLVMEVMDLKQRDDKIGELMEHVPSPGRKLLRTLLAATPEGLNLFANEYVQEAFEAIRLHGHATLHNGMDLDHFLFMITEAMPSTYRLKVDAD